MCKHVVYTTIVNFQMNIVYRRKIKNRKKKQTVGFAYQMRDVPMTNTTAMHSEKPTNCTYSLPLSQQPGFR